MFAFLSLSLSASRLESCENNQIVIVLKQIEINNNNNNKFQKKIRQIRRGKGGECECEWKEHTLADVQSASTPE